MIGRDRTGKIRRDSKTFGKEHDAIAHKVSVEAYASGAGADSLQARAAHWIDDRLAMGKITEKTAVGYREKIAGWAALIGPKPFKKVTTADIDSAFAKLAKGQTPTGRVPSPRTLHHYRTVLATFYSAMVKKREILHSPVLGVEGVTAASKTRRAPTRDELVRMIDLAEGSNAAYGQMATIMRISAALGLRRGEIAALRWQDIDFDGLRVTVARTATQPTPGKIYFKPPKTKAGERTISMLAPTAMLLRAQRGRVSEWRIKAGDAWADNDLVFSTPVGEVLHIEQLSRSAGQIRDKAGVSRDVLPLHGQRHYALTELHRSGVDVLTMQARAGHTDIRSTQVYVTVDADKDREAAEKAAGSLV
ncbi:MAG: site-specific integrase [Aestuariivita sp.]|uniref:tyrosine-type recombinase/integrase n=1 Tax=Aestuariivita sp. TaxID=1872407 RepID=UPI003BAED4BB